MSKPIYHIEWESKKNPGEKHTGPALYKMDEVTQKRIPKTKTEAMKTARHANKSFPNSIHRAVLYGEPKTIELK